MKKIEYLAVIIFIIMILNIILPTFSLAVEEVKISENVTDNNESEKSNIEEDKDEEDNIEIVEEEKEIETEEINENIELIDSEKQEQENTSEGIESKEISEEIEIMENEEFSIYIMDNKNKINPYEKNGNSYLFVPKDMSLSNLKINYTGNIESIDNADFDKSEKQISGEFQNEGSFTIKLKDGKTKKIIIMQSDVPAIFVNLDSGITLNAVNSGSKSTKYKGSINVTGCDDSKNNISQDEIEFKGRGNTTWTMPKRAYQIKLNKKENFLGIGDSKEKKWVLIANYQDPTLLKNKIMNDLCVNSGLSACPNSSYADLYVNGNYVGNYLVCDKIEIKNNRVALSDDKGVLIELDNVYYKEESYYFQSKRENYYTVKEAVSDGNDALTKQAMNSFKKALDAFEDELYSSNPSWDKISKMIDTRSFAKYYLINEFAENTDSYYSSCYLYKDGDNDVIHMGPTWDYDAAFAYGKGIGRGENPFVDYTLNYAFKNEMQRLYVFPEFANLVNEIYITDVKPALEKIKVNQMAESIKQSSKINTIVWADINKYNNLKNQLNSFVENRKSYYNKRYSNKQIEYSTHVENKGWMTSKRVGVSGTEGQSLRVEGLKIKIGSGYEENISVTYRSHVQNVGWQEWVSDGKLSGTTGKSLQVEAVQLKLKNSSKYSIKYRVHVQDIGWMPWVYDGQTAGTTGQSKRIEAIEIQIVEKSNYLGDENIKEDALISYKGHIENVGNTNYGSDGEIIGTIGRGLRLEGLEFKLNSLKLSDISLSIDAHIQNIGWKNELTDKQFIGTEGKSLRLEALRFRLVGEESEKYSIKYRVHVQNIGWQDWKKDGEIAGTEGESLRIEAIQIQIIEK